jgi:hypothetical protein
MSLRRFSSLPLTALCLVSLLIAPLRARAQEEGEALPESVHPGSDSPESVTGKLSKQVKGRRRAQAFLIPLDEKARTATGRVAQAIERALSAARQYEAVDIAKALAIDAEPAVEEKAALGRRQITEGTQQLAAHNYADAVVRYKAGIRGLSGGLAALDAREMASAYLHLAAAQQLSGDPKEARLAREAYLTTALLDPQQKVLASSVDPIAEQPLLIARNDLEQIPIGKLQIETRPAGAHVIIDGQPQGSTPKSVELTGGKHFLRLERTGFYPTAELVEVASRRDTLYSVTLSATPGAATLNQIIAGAADEAARGRSGDRTMELAMRFRLDRVLIGSVSSHGIKVSVLLALADPASGTLLGRQEMLLVADNTDADELDFNTQEAARKLFALDDGRPGLTQGMTLPGQALPSLSEQTKDMPPKPLPEADADNARRSLVPAAPTPMGEPAPGSEATSTPDDVGLVGKERRPLMPAPAAAPADAPAQAQTSQQPQAQGQPVEEPAAATEPAQPKKKKKKKDLHGKSGTEAWDQ